MARAGPTLHAASYTGELLRVPLPLKLVFTQSSASPNHTSFLRLASGDQSFVYQSVLISSQPAVSCPLTPRNGPRKHPASSHLDAPPAMETTQPPPGHGSSSPQSSSPNTSGLSLQSSFRVDTSFSLQGSEREKHPKGKRKRTTSRDKSILESAYNSNPKPDKAARLDIVQRVSLNEKEVQIWFQNRRQNDRRKSRPLSPQEIAALRYGGGIPILPPGDTSFQSDGTCESQKDPRSEDEGIAGLEKGPPSFGDAPTPPSVLNDRPISQSEDHQPESAPSSQKSESERGIHEFSTSISSSTGYLSSRWHPGHQTESPSTLGRFGDDSFRFESSFSSSAPSTTQSSPSAALPGPSSSSQFRLSLSLEGKAEVVSSLQSPPRPIQTPPVGADSETLAPVRANRGLQRSLSALPAVTLPPISTLTAHLPPKLARGRSRDVHAWESCCEADTRDELTLQAENESSGSAVAAITLLRSSSSSASLSGLVHSDSGSPNALHNNPAKRNAPPGKPSLRGSLTKKPKLARTTSSVARLQNLPAPSKASISEADVDDLEKKKPSLAVILSPTGGDSDKENWSPDEDGNPSHRRRQLPPSQPPASKISMISSRGSPILSSANPRRAGRVLGDHNGLGKPSLLSSRANTAPVPQRSQRGGKRADGPMMIFEDGAEGGAEDDEASGPGPQKRTGDVERFMRGEVSPSKKGDMDCIAGLLSLSQGNWR